MSILNFYVVRLAATEFIQILFYRQDAEARKGFAEG